MRVSVDTSGMVQVVTGAASLGQGIETVVAQICADALGCPEPRCGWIGTTRAKWARLSVSAALGSAQLQQRGRNFSITRARIQVRSVRSRPEGDDVGFNGNPSLDTLCENRRRLGPAERVDESSHLINGRLSY